MSRLINSFMFSVFFCFFSSLLAGEQECIYYYRPDSIQELERRLDEFVHWYNNERLHQSLGYETPSEFYNLKEVRKKA